MFWNNEKREKQNEKLNDSLTKFVGVMDDSNVLRRVFYISSAGNLIVWLISLIFSDWFVYIYNILGGFTSKPVTIGLLIPFFLGCFWAYSVFRLKFPDIEDNKFLDSELMSSISYQESSNRRWFVWIFSILTGLLNVLLLMVSVSFVSGLF